MPSYTTPGPITADIHVEVGNTTVHATDRTDTVVQIRPTTPDDKDDLRSVQETKVEFTDGRLTIKTPRARGLFSPKGSVVVEVSMPQGSQLTASVELGSLNSKGLLSNCEVRSSAGDIRIDEARTVRLKTSSGDISLERASGNAEISTGSGEVRVHEIAGNAEIKNSNGYTWVNEIAGDLEVKVSNGNTTVGRAQNSVVVKSAHGNVKIGEVARGTVDLQTKSGSIEVGIREGSSAWLDVNSQTGKVYSDLGATEGPVEGTETVKVHGRTGFGDIVIQRTQSV
ncbi:DUF4097 domain-containing protein [Kitasatospora sp. NPDC006697]|uniref:DUF4097 family beta strand repeat-containing protein n=1 Tax=Kitasatospora sp. NPDC006697 TaxID=3364020 RepID=UPI0036C2E62D